MKLIEQITDLNKAIYKEKRLGFVPTMGGLHKGHLALIKMSKKKCKKTLVSIFVNPTQFNDKNDYQSYPRSLKKDLKLLRKSKVDYVYLPTVDQIYKKKSSKVSLNKLQKVLCAKFRKGHFEGVLDVLNRFVKLLSPKMVFMGEKDYQQFFLVKNFIEKKYKTKVYSCKTIRDSNKMALSSRNILLNRIDINTSRLVANKLFNLKTKISKNKKKSIQLAQETKKYLINKFNIKIQYLECRNLINLSTNLNNKPFRLFVAYYLNNVRLIDNF